MLCLIVTQRELAKVSWFQLLHGLVAELKNELHSVCTLRHRSNDVTATQSSMCWMMLPSSPNYTLEIISKSYTLHTLRKAEEQRSLYICGEVLQQHRKLLAECRLSSSLAKGQHTRIAPLAEKRSAKRKKKPP